MVEYIVSFRNILVDKHERSEDLDKEVFTKIQKKYHQQTNQTYILMLKNIAVLRFNRSDGKADILRDDLVPFDLYIETDYDADNYNNRLNFDWWCAHRILTLNREYSKELLNSCGLRQANTDRDKADIALKYMCLSLKDFYWVKDITTNDTWETVNLFDNSLSNAVVDIALKGKNLTITNQKLIDSDLTTDGVFPKAWYREKSTFYMYKGDKNNSVEKEVKASKYLQRLGFNVLNYEIAYYDKQRVAKSRCFTSKDIAYITAGDMQLNYDIDTSFKQYDMMNLCDYLVGNSDRHQDNWGYLFNESREIIGFAPIFDFNHAFEASEYSLCLPEQLKGKHITMLEMAKNIVKKHKIQLAKLPEKDEYSLYINKRIDSLYKHRA